HDHSPSVRRDVRPLHRGGCSWLVAGRVRNRCGKAADVRFVKDRRSPGTRGREGTPAIPAWSGSAPRSDRPASPRPRDRRSRPVMAGLTGLPVAISQSRGPAWPPVTIVRPSLEMWDEYTPTLSTGTFNTVASDAAFHVTRFPPSDCPVTAVRSEPSGV